MADSRALIFIALVVLFGLGIISLAQRTNQTAGNPVNPSPSPTANLSPTNPPSPTQGPSPTVQPLTEWTTYSSTDHNFALRHPQNVNVDRQGDNSVLFWLFGPTQQENTEFYDGIAMTISSGTYNNRTLREVAQQQADELRNNQATESVGDLRNVTVANLNGFSFEATGLGTRTYTFLPGGQGKYLIIIDSTQDPTNSGYESIVNQMLSTLRIQ